MKTYKVFGRAEVVVCIEVEAENAEEAKERAQEEFGGIDSCVGNGGINCLIGVDGWNHESISIDEDVEFYDAQEIE